MSNLKIIIILLFPFSVFSQIDCGPYCLDYDEIILDLTCSSNLNDSSGYTYTVTPTIGSINATTGQLILQDGELLPGMTVITVECECNELGCKDEEVFNVTITPECPIEVTGYNGPYCQDESFVLSVTGCESNQLSSSHGTIDQLAGTVTIDPYDMEPGIYDIIISCTEPFLNGPQPCQCDVTIVGVEICEKPSVLPYCEPEESLCDCEVNIFKNACIVGFTAVGCDSWEVTDQTGTIINSGIGDINSLISHSAWLSDTYSIFGFEDGCSNQQLGVLGPDCCECADTCQGQEQCDDNCDCIIIPCPCDDVSLPLHSILTDFVDYVAICPVYDGCTTIEQELDGLGEVPFTECVELPTPEICISIIIDNSGSALNLDYLEPQKDAIRDLIANVENGFAGACINMAIIPHGPGNDNHCSNPLSSVCSPPDCLCHTQYTTDWSNLDDFVSSLGSCSDECMQCNDLCNGNLNQDHAAIESLAGLSGCPAGAKKILFYATDRQPHNGAGNWIDQTNWCLDINDINYAQCCDEVEALINALPPDIYVHGISLGNIADSTPGGPPQEFRCTLDMSAYTDSQTTLSDPDESYDMLSIVKDVIYDCTEIIIRHNDCGLEQVVTARAICN